MCHYSIIIPMYNVAPFIERAITSVYNQGLLEDAFELILIDDGSPDESAEIAKKITSGRSNVQLISQENKGLGGARNTGIRNAKGKYILFLDADDWLIKDSLSLLKKIITNEDIIEFSVSVKDSLYEINTIVFSNSKKLKGIDYYFNYKSINSACNKIYKREFLNFFDIRFQEKIYGEDFDFNTKALFFAKIVRSIENKIIVFFQSQNSITRNSDIVKKEKYVFDYLIILSNIKHFKNKNAATKEEERFLNYRMTEKNSTLIVLFLKNRLSLSFYRQIQDDLISENLLVLNEKLRIKKYEIVRIIRKYLGFIIIAFLFVRQNPKSNE